MGMTYEELSVYGRLRKIFRCGPVSMFQVGHTVTGLNSQSLYYIFESFHLQTSLDLVCVVASLAMEKYRKELLCHLNISKTNAIMLLF